MKGEHLMEIREIGDIPKGKSNYQVRGTATIKCPIHSKTAAAPISKPNEIRQQISRGRPKDYSSN